ncbi:MAG: TlpA disulfide reductase family protein [Spirochaetaceae bacterium]|jgi:thiol-disulfide isomerase/thioredoxin|nr:TlpA disulfide reductase family protein [Spirochaetaceae bacterium]
MKKIFLVAIVFFSLFALSSEEITPYDAPVFVNPDLDNQYFISSTLLGESWILLDFYATYCIPCNEELPYIEEMALDYPSDKLTILLVDIDPQGRDIVVPHFQQNPTTLRVLIDRYGKTAEAFGVSATPVNILINPQGQVVYRHDGFESTEDLQELIDYLDSQL